MGILIYAGKKNASSRRLKQLVEDRFGDRVTEQCVGIRELSERFRRPTCDVDVGVMMTTSERDLDELLSLKTIISSMPFILILPDADKALVLKAHSLFPRFVGYGDKGFCDVLIVLEKLLLRSERMRSERMTNSLPSLERCCGGGETKPGMESAGVRRFSPEDSWEGAERRPMSD